MSRTLVFVHGIWDSGRSFALFERLATKRHWQTFAPDLTKALGFVPLSELTNQLAQHIDQQIGREPFHLVGFSMGGVLSKQYILDHDPHGRVQTLTTIGTPHRGSFWANFVPGQGFRDLRPNSDFLKRQQAADWYSKPPILSIYTPYDVMIFPAQNSQWDSQRNIPHPAPIHSSLLRRPAVFESVAKHIIRHNPTNSSRK